MEDTSLDHEEVEGNRSCVASDVRAPSLANHLEDLDDRDPSPPALGVGGLTLLGTNEGIVGHSRLGRARHVAVEGDNWGIHAGMVIVAVRYVVRVNLSGIEQDETGHSRGHAEVDEYRRLVQEEGVHGLAEYFGDRLVRVQVHRETDGNLGHAWVADRLP